MVSILTFHAAPYHAAVCAAKPAEYRCLMQVSLTAAAAQVPKPSLRCPLLLQALQMTTPSPQDDGHHKVFCTAVAFALQPWKQLTPGRVT